MEFSIKSLNNKGYMLVEIILAFSIAMAVMFFITELTIKLKNKNDDLLVRTLATTDQAIIYNTLMKDIYNGTFDCDEINISGNVFEYGTFKNIVNKYSSIKLNSCDDTIGSIKVDISLDVRQLNNKNFDININYG